MPESQPNHEPRTAESLIREARARRGEPCAACPRELWSQEVLMSIALGFGHAPRCLRCLAAGLGTTPDELSQSLLDYIHQRECFAEAWRWACLETGSAPEGVPPQLLRSEAPGDQP